jgi:hypothetical protein
MAGNRKFESISLQRRVRNETRLQGSHAHARIRNVDLAAALTERGSPG